MDDSRGSRPRFDLAVMLDRTERRGEAELWSATSTGGMVATPHYLATAAGAEMLARGGNAFDAAVAASLATAVCDPAGSGLGGMAMMVLHDAAAARTAALLAPCRAPRRALPEEVVASNRYRGYRAVAVPTHVSLLEAVVERRASLPLAALMEPAVRLAEEGVAVTPHQRNRIRQHPRTRAGSTPSWLADDQGQPLAVGGILRQPALARTLRRLAQHGLRDFYTGEIARRIDHDMRAHGGYVRADDLAAVPPVSESSTLTAPYGDAVACTVGPPGGGLALAEMLCVLAALRAGGVDLDLDTADGVVLAARIIQRARIDRRRLRCAVGAQDLGGAARLLEPDYGAAVARELCAPVPGGETAHISVFDRDGNAVALTQSIERSFGAAEAGDDLGFVYNGYLRAFKVRNRRHPHFLRPGAVARSNAAPTVVVRQGQAIMALGCTGSERMASTLFEVLVRLRGQEPFDAVLAPRFHCTPKGVVTCEGGRMAPEVVPALEAAGFRVRLLMPYSFKAGGLQLVLRRGSELVGVGEPRRDGAAAGP